MTKRNRWISLIAFCMLGLITSVAHASHIIGGNLIFSPRQGQAGVYTVSVVLYYDANSSDPNPDQEEVTVSFFRKRDHARQQDLRLKRTGKEPLAFTNPGCARSKNLQINVVTFTADVRLPATQYNDADGYYITWERCCLSSSVVNIKGAGSASMVLYAEFPALQTPNSSPTFNSANGEILCLNTPYQFAGGATDADGDELRYRLETPFSSTRAPYPIDPVAPATTGPYPSAEWSTGYSLARVIPGNPSLKVDPSTGSISLTPTQVGLFVYRVVAEEYRKGRKIGEVHRDYQLLVIDCPNENPPPVGLTSALYPPGTSINDGKEALEVSICQGDTIFLQADAAPEWAYQWQRDGVNIPSGNKAAIRIAQEGVYNVIKTYANRCGFARAMGEKIEVKYRSQPQPEITPGPTAGICEGVAVTLTAQGGAPDWQVRWQKDGQPIPDATSTTLPDVKLEGTYVIQVKSSTSGCTGSDTVQVSYKDRPDAQLIHTATEFCEGDSLRLQTSQGSSLQYVWFRNNAPLPNPVTSTLYARTDGTYMVEITDKASGCSSLSQSVAIRMNPVPEVLFDSIPAQCGLANARLNLVASPVGGVFSGRGVAGAVFDSQRAGAGSHPITYLYTSANGCTRSATRIAEVVQAPRVQLASNKSILAGSSVLIRSSVTEGATYSWSPPEGLDDATIAQPTASPAQTTTYRLRVSTADGCYNEDEITIEVLPTVTIPNGFTPNGDGVNDTWQLADIGAYPGCEVEIFNRWGSRVFRSVGYLKEWDGLYEGQELPAATYYYVIKLNEQLPTRSGSVTIFR
ncbi:gliding motility-associated C-terminal domain-containing protein [Telluribacter sp. SYSU D00476]|uniref:gliding motility-associated C-terminal domain-containing protein n=1 Tax=Telluribacter sp. SYSU D00476 TaxID=2811430 RepID=UPI001FF66971|nr:gliding motility-associated C-terminal domain-containing protein [Telluribacter sp. SYSU D00476]